MNLPDRLQRELVQKLSLRLQREEKKTLPQRLILLPYEENNTQEADIVISLDDKVQYGLLGMKPKQYVLGIGCRRGKTYDEIQDFVGKKLEEIQIH